MSLDIPSIQQIDGSGLRFAIIASRYNEALVDSLVQHASATITAAGAEAPLIERVPGAAELPYAASAVANHSQFDAIIVIGVVIAGDTNHHEIIGDSTATALLNVSIAQKVPVINGILVVKDRAQAEARAGETIIYTKMEDNQPVTRRSQRRENRMCTVQFLYQWESNKPKVLADDVCQFFENQEEDRAYYAFAEELALGTIENVEVIDGHINEHANNWTFDRIAKVDLAILRLAIYELLYRTDIPPIVSINEAIDLSKVFSNPDSKRFINGILDKMKDKITRPLRKAAD